MTWHPDNSSPTPDSQTRRGDGMTQPEDSDPRRPSGDRPPSYAVVISASDWVKEHFPAAGANLRDALHTGHDRHRDREPEPDLRSRTITPNRK